MPWNETDIAFKKLNNKRVTTNTGKGVNEERGAITININADEIWIDSIPGTPPVATTSVVEVYNYAARLTLIEDLSVPNQQAWFATTITNTVTANNGSNTSEAARLMDWIPDKYDAPGTVAGNGYEIKVYDKDNVLIPKGDASQWFFDYQTGILMFRSANTDSGTVSSRAPFKIVGYRYIGNKGAGSVSSVGGTNGIITDLLANAPITSTGNLQLDVAYSPTWTGLHTFSNSNAISLTATSGVHMSFGTSATAPTSIGQLVWDGTSFRTYNTQARTFLYGDFSNVSGILGLANGGTNANLTAVNGGVVYSTASGLGITSAGVANQVLISTGGGAPVFGAIDLSQSAAVTGALGVANGGTGTTTQFTAGSIVFAGTSGVYSQDNANLFWNNTNDLLGLGTASPEANLHILPASRSMASWLTSGALARIDATTITDNSTAASGTAATAVAVSIARPTFAATNAGVTMTNVATLYIENAPLNGTNTTFGNTYALWVNSGRVRFGGQLLLTTAGSSAGIIVGGDVQLYRSAANILGIPDIVEIRSGNGLRFNNSADTKFTSFAPGSQTVTINYTLPVNAPALNDVLKATSVSGTDPATVTLGWAAASGITSLGGQTGATQTFANDTNVTISSATNTHTLGWTGQLAVSRGGTGASTFTTNGVLLGNGTSAISATAAGTANQVLRVPGAGGAPTFGAIDLAQSAAVTGILPVANGGTGTSTAFTTGGVVFAGASGVYSQDNANYFWDNTNKRLGLGTASPGATLHVNPATGSQASWLTDGVFFRVQAGTRTNSSTATSGTAATAVFASFGQPTLAATNTSVTTTDAATVYIANAPAAGTNMTITNPYALWVDAGLSRFDDPIGVGINPVADTMIYGNITTSSNLTRRGVFGYNTVTGAITSTFPVGVAGRLDVNAGANTISYVAGMTGSMRTQSGQSGNVTEAYGIDFDAWHAGSSNVTSLVCGRAFSSVRNTSGGTISNWAGYLVTLDMQSGGTNSAVTNAFGFDFSASLAGTSTITNLTGYNVQNPTGSQTITNFYGIRINDLTRGTNNYGIYFDGTSGLARQGIWWNADTNLYRSAANTLKTDDELVVGQRISSGVVVLTDGANISLNASLGNHFRVTLGGNRTLNAPTNAVDGQRITIEVIQDGIGSRTLTLTTGSSGAFIFGTDITAITLTTTANKRDLIGCVYSSSLARWMVVSFVKGF